MAKVQERLNVGKITWTPKVQNLIAGKINGFTEYNTSIHVKLASLIEELEAHKNKIAYPLTTEHF